MTMKMYEMGRLFLESVLPPLYKQVRARLRKIIQSNFNSPRILDVGGRKSPYTIGLPALVTVMDLPRQSEVQQQLNLGVDDRIIEQIRRRRSNIENVVLGDMTCSGLPDEAFDLVVSVEVLEHVEDDERFVGEVWRVLKPGGMFLMTTPNGDWVENKNPDHKRHYKRKQLNQLLEKYFASVAVDYAIVGGNCRRLGLKSWSLRRPDTIALSMVGNIVNGFQSAHFTVKNKAAGTHHLIAVALKQ
jgi:SAM-dependent methyltransferase